MLLAGDAASLINPLTGEGIFYAVLSGALAGAAAVGGGDAGRGLPAGAGRAARAGTCVHSSTASWASRWPRLMDAVFRAAAPTSGCSTTSSAWDSPTAGSPPAPSPPPPAGFP